MYEVLCSVHSTAKKVNKLVKIPHSKPGVQEDNKTLVTFIGFQGRLGNPLVWRKHAQKPIIQHMSHLSEACKKQGSNKLNHKTRPGKTRKGVGAWAWGEAKPMLKASS
jgi:hypothetical protein